MASQVHKRKKIHLSEKQNSELGKNTVFQKGYKTTTIEQIAKAAGYSKRTVYLDFLNKDELFIEVCAMGAELLLSDLLKIPLNELPVEECIDPFLKVYINFSRKHSKYFRMIFAEATPEIVANCSPEVRKRIKDLEHACLATVVAWAEKAIEQKIIPKIDPWEIAGITVGSATGIILLSMGGSQTLFTKKKLETLVNRSVWMIWNGLTSNK